jgi:nitric oxide reductase large subunit
LFTGQVVLGTLLAHYYVERDAFFGLGELLGVDVLQWLPFAIAKTDHLDLGSPWIATLWLGAGLFLPGHEPDHRSTLVDVLLVALVVVVCGGFAGVWSGVKGVIGVSHHYWWIGQPGIWLPFGSVFSTLELIPLIIILFEALNEYRALATSDESFAYTLPFVFILASGVWNFVGAGVLGFFINLPLINYYEHGTYPTVGHVHAAMFGAFGFLAVGMATYMLRLSVRPGEWVERRLRWAFWLWNVGPAVKVSVSVLPVGFLQLEVAFTSGYDAARSLAFYNRDLVQLLFWARCPGTR